MNQKLREKWLQYQYYVIIGILSLFAVFVIPLLGSAAELAWALPTTTVGWLVYVITKLCVATLNILIFHCFILQGKANIADNPRYIEANEILLNITNNKELRPMSPKEWHRLVYGKKGITIFATTIISAIGLTQAVLVFDWVSMLSYLFTVIMGVIFGVLQMGAEENYWTGDYYRYAILQKEENERKKAEMEKRVELVAAAPSQPENDSPDATGGSNLLVSPNSSGGDGNIS